MDLSRFTEQMRAMLPQWMKMAKDPDSVGAQFLNVFGMEFEDVQTYLDWIVNNHFIGTASIDQIDITYKVPLALPVVSDVVEIQNVFGMRKDAVISETNRVHFTVVNSLRDFYLADPYMDVAILDRTQGVVYLRPGKAILDNISNPHVHDDGLGQIIGPEGEEFPGSTPVDEEEDKDESGVEQEEEFLSYEEGNPLFTPFVSVEINGTLHYEYSLHHIWNPFDEFGMLLGIYRLHGERNAQFKERILDVFRKPANATKTGLMNGISRELGLNSEDIKINEFADKAFRGSMINDDGTPSQKLINYVERINKVLGFTWDNMSWGEAYWRSVEESQIGLEYLPHIWDVNTDMWKREEFQSGIGDGDDLLVTAPKDEENIRNFNYYLGLRGKRNGVEEIDPELRFKYKITATGKIMNEEYKPESYKYSIISSEIIYLHYIVRAVKEYMYTTNIDFNPNTPGYIFDDKTSSNVEVVTGNTIMSKDNHRYLRVGSWLSTRSVSDTPIIDELKIKWYDSTEAEQEFILDSQDDFTRNDATVDTNLTNVFVSEDGTVELGFGDFYQMIDTEGSFKEGTHSQSVEIIRRGSVQLKLPKNQ